MSSFEWNKVIASVLTAMIVAMVAGVLASQVVSPHRLHQAAYLPPGAEAGASAATAAAPAAAAIEPIEPLMAQADVARGQQLARSCVQCHTFEQGGANKIGPNLFGVTERNVASVPGFQYSPALAAHQGEHWNVEGLNVLIARPQQYARGTKMAFPGIPKPQDRADVVAYLQSLK
ncbi:MAG: cytochrome c family protein [Alphaproteobacteria bacterium]